MIDVVKIITDVARKTSDLYVENNPKTAPINFIADNFTIVGQELNKLNATAKGQKNKYPAILLFTDSIGRRSAPLLKQWDAEVVLHILIVTDAVQGNSEAKLKKIYRPVLYPIYDAFKQAIKEHPLIYTRDVEPAEEVFDRFDLVAILGKNRLFPDKLDGIEIRNLRLRLIKEKCFLNNKN